MKAIVCLDDNGGMRFNGRRQSRDRVVVEKIMQLIGNNGLWMTDYSSVLFPHATIISEGGLGLVNYDKLLFPHTAAMSNCESDCEFVFIEDANSLSNVDIDELYIFKWNRSYPSDEKFSLCLDDFELLSSTDFSGFSHENITLEIYRKRG